MFKILSIVALGVAFASAASVQSGVAINTASDNISPLGVVDPVIVCGGSGTPGELRISGCEGYCKFTPGTRYDLEQDFIPSSAARQLAIRLSVSAGELTFEILREDLPNSSVHPGVPFTAKYSFVPNGILSGRTIEFKGEILHAGTELVEVCSSAQADVV